MAKKHTIAAVSAGLLVGTAAGFAFGLPGLTSAASDTGADTSATEESTVAGSIDLGGTDVDGDEHQNGQHVDGRGRGPRGGGLGSPEVLADVLGVDAATLQSEFAAGKSVADIAAAQGVDIATVVDALIADLETHLSEHVADGSLTQDEADSRLADAETMITDRLDDVPQAFGGHGMRGAPGKPISDAVLELLGIDAATLREAFSAGKSIADVAAEQGVDLNTVIDTMVAEVETHLSEHVANGSLTQEEADARLADAETMVTERVNTVPPAGGPGMGDGGPMGGPMGGRGHGDRGHHGGDFDGDGGADVDQDGHVDDGTGATPADGTGTGFDTLLNSDA